MSQWSVTLDAMHLFSYGTLQLPAVQVAIFGRALPGAPDAIVGYLRRELRISDPAVIATSGADVHPILVPSDDPAAEVPGTVFRLTPQELAAADAYEVADYTRVEVPLRSGLRAWVYVFADSAASATRLVDDLG